MKVIVIGSGLAGLTAAYISFLNGNEVTILEKTNTIGGNSLKASSGINFLGLNDTMEMFFQDTIKSGGCNTDLVSLLIEHSECAKQFLQHCGLNFNKVFLGGGHSVARTHSINDDSKRSIGSILVNCVHDKIKMTNIKIKTSCRVIDLDIKNNKILGVVCENMYIKCDQVILATGGYGCNSQLLGSYYGKFPTTNGTTTTGDGVVICMKNNLKVSNLNDVQIHPTSFIDPLHSENKFKFLAPEAFRGLGGVLIDKTGNRFVNELETRDNVTNTIINKSQHVYGCPNVLLIVDNNILTKFGESSKFYLSKKLITKFDNLFDISQKYSINFPNLKKSLQTLYKPYYVAVVTPAVHYTMGGVNINVNAQVMSIKGILIEGLYACGEVTTGVHGKNRLVGNSLLECVVFGIIAGNGK